MKRPNIIYILSDDLGWRDLSVEGSTLYESPNIDRIAAGGMRFTQGYAACQVCSPSRASILTGKYPPRHGITDWIGAVVASQLAGKQPAVWLQKAQTKIIDFLQNVSMIGRKQGSVKS